MNAGRSGQDDDWMIRSMTRYESLYMFELPQPTQCIEWSRQGTAICVAGCSTETSCEITQLALPGKLLLHKDETHWAKRDFRMINGTLSMTPVTSLQFISGSDILASAGQQPTITLWRADQSNIDCLQENGQLQLTLPPSLLSQDQLKHSHTLIAASSDRPSELLTALSLSLASVQTLDLATTQTIYSLSTAAMDDAVHGLVYIPGTAGLLATCSGDRGEVCVWDPREKELGTIFKMNLKTGSESFGFAVSSDAHPHTKLALLCAASGNVLLYDVRQCREPYAMGVLEGINNIRGWFKKTTRIPCIKFSDVNSSFLSVSGCCSGVAVYDSSKWSRKEKASPIFTHTGHEEDSPTAQVLIHSWQPKTNSSILSADSDGSLHAWQW